MKKDKSGIKRLFLFAGYDAAGVVDEAELMYVRALAGMGDVIYIMDSDAPRAQIDKITKIPHVLHAAAARHGEYDFGSYKRGYIYARDAGILDDYDIVYMVNNSVYAPLMDLGPIVQRMEALPVDAFGPVIHPYSRGIYIQSWFIGMRPAVFRSKWFDDFITSVTHQSDKGAVVYLYEYGFSKNVEKNGLRFDGLYSCPGRSVYNRVRGLYRRGLPFLKRCAFVRHNGALGRQVDYVMRHLDAPVRDAIMDNARRVYGADKINRIITRNPVRIAWRGITYSLRKVFIEGI